MEPANKIREFWSDTHMVDAVQQSFIAYLSQAIAERAFKGQDIQGFAEARNIFLEWKKELDKEFSPKPRQEDSEFNESE
jgi:hypothetical protein